MRPGLLFPRGDSISEEIRLEIVKMRQKGRLGDVIAAWVQASRPPFFVATLVPLFVGWVLARSSGPHPGRFLLVVAACFMVHLATNLANDYFDEAVGVDSGESIGGSRVIQEGKISRRAIMRAIVLLYALACAIAVYLVAAFRLPAILPFVLFAFLSSLFYVAPPVRYGYHGLGELLVGINMGPIMVVGTYWIIAGSPSWKALYVSIPIGLMVASILYYQSLPDMTTDLEAGKRTLSVKLGRKRAAAGLILFFIAIYTSILALVLLGLVAWPACLCVVGIPLFLRLAFLVGSAEDWVLLDRYGGHVRLLYFINGCAIIAGLL
jgi:1,4-dihydroxy-2-naphthoate octaprenyltransferase